MANWVDPKYKQYQKDRQERALTYSAQKQLASVNQNKTQSQSAFSSRSNDKWYTGNMPTAREIYARAYNLYQNDKTALDAISSEMNKAFSTPGNPYYNPYRVATNQSYIDDLSSYGVDVSGGINQDFFDRNAGYQQFLTRSAITGSPTAPGKNASAEEWIAYDIYQLQRDEETTQKAENEWAEMQKEIAYYAGKGWSDEEILTKVNSSNKYGTLRSLQEGAANGTPVPLNRAVGYSSDAQYGAIWAARNGGSSGDLFTDSVLYALGQGVGYSGDKTKEAQRDITSASYMPYLDGSTMDEANLRFGRTSYDQNWLNENRNLLAGEDAGLYQRVYEAYGNTEMAKQQKDKAYAYADALFAQGYGTEEILSAFSDWYQNAGTGNPVDMTMLKRMDDGRATASPIDLTDSVNWRWEDFEKYVQSLGTGKGSRENAAAAANGGTTSQNMQAEIDTAKAELERLLAQEPENSSAIANEIKVLQDRGEDVSGYTARVAAASSTPAPESTEATAEPSPAPTDAPATIPESSPSPTDAPAATPAPGPAHEAAPASLEAASESEQGEAREESQASSALVEERARLLEDYQFMTYAQQSNMAYNPYAMQEVADKINELTAQIGDGLTLRVEYTDEQAQDVLRKAYAGREELTPDEQRIFDSFFNDYGDLLGAAGTENDGFRDYGLAFTYGSTAQSALSWSDAPEVTTDEAVNTIMQIVRDSRSAQAQGMELEAWYDANPDAKARVMGIRDTVEARRAANAEANKKAAEEEQASTLAYCVSMLQKKASGQALDENEQQVYNQLMQANESELRRSDSSFNEAIYQVNQALVDGSFEQRSGVSEPWIIAEMGETVKGYYTADAKLAATAGLTLEELYTQYPQLRKDESTLMEMARQEVERKWTPANDEDTATGLGVFKTIGLGLDSGWNQWLSGNVAFAQSIVMQDDEVVSSGNYDYYLRTYGLTNARREYSIDLATAIYSMDDNDPLKEKYSQEFMQAQLNGTDIFQIPFNFTEDRLRQVRQDFEKNVKANADLVNEMGTWAEKNLLYPITTSVTENSLSMLEASVVGGVTGSSVLGTAVGYGIPQFGRTALEARDRGLSANMSRAVALVDASATVALESPMLAKYTSNLFKNSVVDAVSGAVRADGASFFTKLGRGVKELAKTGAEEAIQENIENIASGSIKSVAYGDITELTSQLAPANILETSAMSFVTSLFLSGQGKLASGAVNAVGKLGSNMQQNQAAQQETAEEQTDGAPEGQQVGLRDTEVQNAEQNQVQQQEEPAAEQQVSPSPSAAEVMAKQAVQEIVTSPEAMQRVTEARSAQIVQEQVGLGAMNTEAVASAQQSVEEAQTDVEKARKTLQQKNRKLRGIVKALEQANEKAGTPQGAATIAQLAPQVAQLRQEVQDARAQWQEAKEKLSQARDNLQTIRTNTYTQIQSQAQRQAEQEMNQSAQDTRLALQADTSIEQVQQAKAVVDQDMAENSVENLQNLPEIRPNLTESNQYITENGANSANAENQLEENTDISQVNQAQRGKATNRQRSRLLQDVGRQKVKSPVKIMENLTRKLGFGYYTGIKRGSVTDTKGKKSSVDVRAYADTRAGLVSVSTAHASDFNAVLPAIAQNVQAKTGFHTTNEMVKALPAEDRANRSNAELEQMVFEKFFTDYMRNGRDMAMGVYGKNSVQAFEYEMRKAGMLKAMRQAQDDIANYQAARMIDKVAARTVDASQAGRKQESASIRNALRKFVVNMVDSTAAADRVDAMARKRGDTNMSTLTMNESMRMQNYAGKIALAQIEGNLTTRGGDVVGKGLAQTLAESGIRNDQDLDDLNSYAILKHSLDREAQGLTVLGESTNLEAQRLELQRLENEKPHLAKAQKALSDWWYDFLQTWGVDQGLITQEQYDNYKKDYPNYVPTVRDREAVNALGRSAAGQGNNMRAPTGSDLDIMTPIDGMLRMVNTMVQRAYANETMRIFDDLYQTGEGYGVFAREMEVTKELPASSPDDFCQEMITPYIQPLTGTVEGNGNLGGVVRMIDRNGVGKAYQFDDVTLYKALAFSGSSANQQADVLRSVRKLVTTMSMLTTGSNPLFVLKNIKRDLQQSVNQGSYASNYFTGFIKAIASAHDVWTRKSEKSKQYVNLGGGGWMRLNGTTSSQIKQMRSKLVEDYGRTPSKRIKDKIWNIVTFERINEVAETTFRYAEYKYGKHDLSTDVGRQRAFLAAMTATTDFARSGNGLAAASAKSVIPFWNAAIQGTYQTFRNFTGPERNRLMARAAKTLVNNLLTGALGVWVINQFGSDDDKEWYAKLPENMRLTNLILPLSSDSERQFLRLPIAQDALGQAFYALGNQLALGVYGDEDARISLSTICSTILGNMIPTDLISTPITDVLQNQTYTGNTLVSERLQDLPVTQQYNDNTPGLFVNASRLLNMFGIDLAPVSVQYLAQQYTGFIGQVAIPVMQANMDGFTLGGTTNALWKTVRNSLTIDPAYTNDINDKYYETRDILTAITSGVKQQGYSDLLSSKLTPEQAQEAVNTATVIMATGGEGKRIQDEISALYDQMDTVQADAGLNDHEKALASRELMRQIVNKEAEFLTYTKHFMETYVSGQSPISFVLTGGAKADAANPVAKYGDVFSTDEKETYMVRAMEVFNQTQNTSHLPHPSYTINITDAIGAKQTYNVAAMGEDVKNDCLAAYREAYKETVNLWGVNWDSMTMEEKQDVLSKANTAGNKAMKEYFQEYILNAE